MITRTVNVCVHAHSEKKNGSSVFLFFKISINVKDFFYFILFTM